MDQLAEQARVSRRMLINVEQGAANPSITTLLKISDALGVGLPALVEPPASQQLRVVRSGEGAVLWTSENGGQAVLVAGTRPPGVVELWAWTLGPQDTHTSEPHSPGTKEVIHVLQGHMTVTVGDNSAELNAGDAMAFDGDVPHSYRNPHKRPAKFSLAVFDPGGKT